MSISIDTMPSAPALDSVEILQNHSIGKRKRSPEAPAVTAAEDRESEATKQQKFHSFLDDLLEVLRSCDTSPSTLEFPITTSVDDTHSAKRTKLATSTSTVTIASRLASHAYRGIEEVSRDIANAISASTSSDDEQSKRRGLEKFEATYKSLIARETVQNPDAFPALSPNEEVIKQEDDTKLHLSPSGSQASQTVLTVFGGVQGVGKQLFSSLKRTTSNALGHSHSPTQSKAWREANLPNGISTTSIIPVHSIGGKGSNVRTLGELCPAPSHFALLDPPKQSSQTTTRGTSVGWYKPTSLVPQQVKPGRGNTYTNQQLSGGDWLSYNIPPAASSQSTGEKRKQRDRALSTGEPHPEQSEEDLERSRVSQESHQQIRDAALFKSVYSSFAPSYDNSTAVVPQQLKCKLWWHKVGQYKHLPRHDPEDIAAFERAEETALLDEINPLEDEDVAFKEAVDYFEESLEFPSPFKVKELSKANGNISNLEDESEDKNVAALLQEISDLLETLNSYQHVRNVSLATKTQTSVGQNKSLTELSGSPTTPCEAEIDVYNMLKHQLAIMVAVLPPYAVAKLNGNQLENLNIKTQIQVETAYHKGIIPEEASKPQPSPMNGAHTSASRPPPSNSGRNLSYHTQGATPIQRNQYAAARPNASTYMSSTRVPTMSNGYNIASAHGGHKASFSHQQQATPTHMPQYSNGSRSFQTPNGYTNYNAHGASPVPRTQQFQRPPSGHVQQRPPSAPTATWGLNASVARSASPHNSTLGYGHSQQAPRPSFSASPGRGSPQRPPGIPPNAANHNATAGVSVNVHGATINLSPEEQERMMQRNRDLLGQGITSRHSSDTPPQGANGQSPSRPQSNGVAGLPSGNQMGSSQAPSPMMNGNRGL